MIDRRLRLSLVGDGDRDSNDKFDDFLFFVSPSLFSPLYSQFRCPRSGPNHALPLSSRRVDCLVCLLLLSLPPPPAQIKTPHARAFNPHHNRTDCFSMPHYATPVRRSHPMRHFNIPFSSYPFRVLVVLNCNAGCKICIWNMSRFPSLPPATTDVAPRGTHRRMSRYGGLALPDSFQRE